MNKVKYSMCFAHPQNKVKQWWRIRSHINQIASDIIMRWSKSPPSVELGLSDSFIVCLFSHGVISKP